jgi:hypothetical protein
VEKYVQKFLSDSTFLQDMFLVKNVICHFYSGSCNTVLFLVITEPTFAVCKTMSELIPVCNVTDMTDV